MNGPLLADCSPAASQEGLEQIELRLQCRLGGRVRNLRLVLHGDGVVLRGLTRTYYGKQLAQHAVMETVPWPIVANEIEVK